MFGSCTSDSVVIKQDTLSEILSNTQNTVDRKEDKNDEGQQGAGRELMNDKQVLNLCMHCAVFAVFLIVTFLACGRGYCTHVKFCLRHKLQSPVRK